LDIQGVCCFFDFNRVYSPEFYRKSAPTSSERFRQYWLSLKSRLQKALPGLNNDQLCIYLYLAIEGKKRGQIYFTRPHFLLFARYVISETRVTIPEIIYTVVRAQDEPGDRGIVAAPVYDQ
jgi:hypothetical protein